MRPLPALSALLFVVSIGSPPSADSTERVERALARIAESRPSESVVAWIYFSDRAGAERDPVALDRARASAAPKALERRARRGALTTLVADDLPVHAPYVRALSTRGARIRGVSRWLNAASVEAPAGLVADLARLPFVARAERVPVGWGIRPPEPARELPPDLPARGPDSRAAVAAPPVPGDTAYYGGSFRQLAMMQVPTLHAAGLSGAGVLVCMLDSGFRTTHRALRDVNVVARRDFIHGDEVVDYVAGEDSVGQASHGTYTLACVAGSLPGTYSGPAFGARVALAKTEWVPTETPVEMDYWQFGAEWADSLGADIISSSLGYVGFNSPYPSYTYADLDGRTTVVARAALAAARRGIVVVNSAGNSGLGKLVSPSDADSVVSAGAVDSFNVVTGFSSRGPSADGRIKPDVTAMGFRVRVPSFSNDSTYAYVNGTSFSAPLTSGVVALLLEAYPYWGPFEVLEALRGTALNHAAPDTVIGWGLVQAAAARNWIPSTTAVPVSSGAPLDLAVGPNPLRAGTSLWVRFTGRPGETARLELLDLAGRRIGRLHEGAADGPRELRFDGRRPDGGTLRAGVYWVRLSVRADSGSERTRAVKVVVVG